MVIRYKLSCVFRASLETNLQYCFGILILTGLHMPMFDLSPVAWSALNSAHYSMMYATKLCLSKMEMSVSRVYSKPWMNLLIMKIMIMQRKHLPTVSFSMLLSWLWLNKVVVKSLYHKIWLKTAVIWSFFPSSCVTKQMRELWNTCSSVNSKYNKSFFR